MPTQTGIPSSSKETSSGPRSHYSHWQGLGRRLWCLLYTVSSSARNWWEGRTDDLRLRKREDVEEKDGFNSEAGLLGEAWKLPGLSILWRLPGLQDRHPPLTCASRCKGVFMCISPELTPTSSWGEVYLSDVHITGLHSSEMVMHFSRVARPCSCCRHATLSHRASEQPWSPAVQRQELADVGWMAPSAKAGIGPC